MVRLYGCTVSDQHARVLVASLIGSGSTDALAAAEVISGGLGQRATATQLTPGMRDAILQVMRSPPSGLAGLRDALIKDQQARR